MLQKKDGAAAVAARVLGPWARDVDARSLRADAFAGLLGAVLALPQAIAFAALAGLPPVWGLWTAIVPCIVAALAGSSRFVCTGPTNAVSLALAAMLSPLALRGSDEYLRLALVATLGVGLIQTALALLRLGTLAHFISPSVLLGFTSGAALLIAWHAVESLAGDGPAVALACGTLVAAWVLRRVWPRGPFLLLALVTAGFAAWAAMRAGVVLAFVGELPRGGPDWGLPALAWSDVPRLAGISFALSVVALGQSIAIAKTLAARSDTRLDANREVLGQGLANLAGAFASCFVASGSLNRSLPNLEAGARTPLASVFSGLFVLLLALVAAPVIAWIPAAAIAGLLLWVAATLVDRQAWRERLELARAEAGIAAATFVATLALPLEQAILGGVGLSLVVYLERTARPALRTMGFDRAPRATAGGAAPAPMTIALDAASLAAAVAASPERPMVVVDGASDGRECPQLKMLRMEGSVWFGAVAHVWERLQALRAAPDAPKFLLVMCKSMNFVDHAGAAMWEQEHARRLAIGGDLFFHRPRPEVMRAWEQRHFLDRLGADHVFPDKRRALATIVPRLDPAICAGCRVRLYEECARMPGPPATAQAASSSK